MPRASRALVEELTKEIRRRRGNVAAVCASLGLARSRFYRIMADYPEVRDVLDEERENVGDEIRHKIIEDALRGNTALLIFYAKTQMGWRENQRIEVESVEKDTSLMDAKFEAFNRMLADWSVKRGLPPPGVEEAGEIIEGQVVEEEEVDAD